MINAPLAGLIMYDDCQIQIMNSELDWEKIVEWSHTETTYLLRVVTTPQLLELELEDKYTGELWHSAYSNLAIEQLTQKAKNKKKYSVFVNMLRTALERTKENLFIEILSYREITIKTMKNGKASNVIPPEQAAKRFLILNYNIDFEKIQFPISIKCFTDASPERLRFTIKRLSQELYCVRSERSESELERENAYLKYELEAVKSRLKAGGRQENGNVLQSKVEELQKEVNQKGSIIEKLNVKVAEAEKEKQTAEERLKESDEKIKDLTEQLKNRQTSTHQKQNVEKVFGEKVDSLIKKMEKLSQQLIHAHEKQKKNEIKIATLEKELQSMQKNQSKTVIRYKEDRENQNSPRSKIEERQMSIKSGRSQKSGKSNNSKKNYSNLHNTNKYNNPNQNYKKYSNKKSSVYDSDTESSRMRRLNNGRSSPYRLGSSTLANNKKSIKGQQQRSRSKSRDKVTSPKASKIIESQMYSQAFQSDDSEQRFERLQKKIDKNKPKPTASRKPTSRVSTSTNQASVLQNKMQSLEQMIRKAAQSTKKAH